MTVTTSSQFLLDGKSFVTKTDGNTATVVRTSTGKALSQTEKEIAGNYYNGGFLTLDTLPDNFGNLTDLAMLYLNWNNLTSLPESMDQLTNLIYLVLSNNYLTSIFNNIGNLENLILLDLGYNEL